MRLYLFIPGVLLTGAVAFGQVQEEERRAHRWVGNFENIQVDTLSERVVYEQRLYRNPLIGMLELKKVFRDRQLKELTPLFQGTAIGSYDTSGNRLPDRPLLSSGTKLPGFFLLQNKGYKWDFWFQPVVATRFGYRLKPFESNISVLLNTQVYLWKGMSLNAGILFPLTNDLDNRPRIIRPAPLFLNQFLKRGAHFASITAGLLHNDRYGLHAQYRRDDLRSAWSWGVEAGLTGMYYYPMGGIYYESPEELVALADVAYRFPGSTVTLKLSGGQYLYQDRGVRFDFIRQFTGVEIGLYAMKTTNGATAGFNFAVPLPPGKLVQNRRFRLRMGDEFRWEYSYTRGFRIGGRYREAYQLDQKLRQYHQDYLRAQLKNSR